ncbi:hypothetical protein BDA96_04G084400 [Sorghum bicolor]|uniref:Uncharacterized protein n=2 Tax=Sorghum bicolor TaxID=4558 RepID=A0A921R1G9_SORBI|nr:hypothetical protein BDA96_04G084400 [Sorghum bicolor]KXG29693.1 hypothetical protein SORBI_3004G077700 [Sorghum bicolor]
MSDVAEVCDSHSIWSRWGWSTDRRHMETRTIASTRKAVTHPTPPNEFLDTWLNS